MEEWNSGILGAKRKNGRPENWKNGMMEYWKNGVQMECWDIGRMEYWVVKAKRKILNISTLSVFPFFHHSIIPIFHCSNFP